MALGLVFNIMYNKYMYFIKKNWLKLVSLTYLLLILPTSNLFAGTYDPSSGLCPDGVTKINAGQICNPIPNVTSIPGLIQLILTGAITIGIPIVALAVIYSGFLFVAARGNSEKLTKAKDSLLYTIIGAAILLGAWAIAQLISATVTGLAT